MNSRFQKGRPNKPLTPAQAVLFGTLTLGVGLPSTLFARAAQRA
jgi:hypothetical protein